MRHKKLIILLSVLAIIICGFSVFRHIQQNRYENEKLEYYVSGIAMVKMELEEFQKSGDSTMLSRIGIDSSSLYDAIGQSKKLSSSPFIAETMLTFGNRSIATPSFVKENCDELISIMNSIENAPTDEYPYTRLELLLNSISA